MRYPGKKNDVSSEMCRTRWVERHDAYDVFIDLFLPIVSCLEEIVRAPTTAWNRDTRTEAQSFLLALSQFSFLVTLLVPQRILGYTRGLSVKLQGRYVDVVRAHKDIESVKNDLEGTRSQVDRFQEHIYEEALRMGGNVGIEASVPRLAGRQQHRSNNPADTPIEYYKRNLTIPLLDHIISELDNRFDLE